MDFYFSWDELFRVADWRVVTVAGRVLVFLDWMIKVLFRGVPLVLLELVV